MGALGFLRRLTQETRISPHLIEKRRNFFIWTSVQASAGPRGAAPLWFRLRITEVQAGVQSSVLLASELAEIAIDGEPFTPQDFPQQVAVALVHPVHKSAILMGRRSHQFL